MRTVSSQHTGGGLMIQNMTHVSHSNPSLQPHLSKPMYYPAQTSPQGGMVEIPPHSSQQHFYNVPATGVTVGPSHSPYSPENGPGICALCYIVCMTLDSDVCVSIFDLCYWFFLSYYVSYNCSWWYLTHMHICEGKTRDMVCLFKIASLGGQNTCVLSFLRKQTIGYNNEIE